MAIMGPSGSGYSHQLSIGRDGTTNTLIQQDDAT